MALLLSLESSTTICSAALHEDGEWLAGATVQVPQSASSQLAVMADQVMRRAEKKAGDLDAVAVSAGPGSYTGLRIGVATAKGMCTALQIPLIAVGTLESMVHQVIKRYHRQTLLCPMLDARRMEVYCLLADSEGAIVEPIEARVIDESSYSAQLSRGPILFFGSGAEKVKTVVRHSQAKFLDGIVPDATAIGELATRKFELNEFADVSSFEPFYLKDFVAKKPKTV